MLRSMTGYGRSDFTIGDDIYSIEARSLNSRFLDLQIRMPERFTFLEPRVRQEIKRRFSRGYISLSIKEAPGSVPSIAVNISLARRYMEVARLLRDELGVAGEIDIPTMLKLKDILTRSEGDVDMERDWEGLSSGLSRVLDQIGEWRAKEGEAIRKDILKRLEGLEGFVSRIEERAPRVVDEYRERLKEEVERLLSDRVDETRLLQEVTIFAQRIAITEEIVRFKSHIRQFRDYLTHDEPVGKRCDFLCQEILREVNTMASKANDLEIVQATVEIKGELERIREQVQNVE